MIKVFLTLFFLPVVSPITHYQDTLLKGPYWGQNSPAKTPVIFTTYNIYKSQNEVNSVFTPDLKEFYFSRFMTGKGYAIIAIKLVNYSWSKPQPVHFTSTYSEFDMFITPDGNYY